MVDTEKVQAAVRLLLEAIGEDPEREGLVETPKRVAQMYTELLAGYEETPETHLSKTFNVENNDVVIERDIHFYSLCEHHLLPFFGHVHIAYIPDGKVAGLSKLARLVEMYARRLQLQEQMTTQIAQSLMDYLPCKGVMVIAEAEHLCMSMRGVKKPGTQTRTMACRGIFAEDADLRQCTLDLMLK